MQLGDAMGVGRARSRLAPPSYTTMRDPKKLALDPGTPLSDAATSPLSFRKNERRHPMRSR